MTRWRDASHSVRYALGLLGFLVALGSCPLALQRAAAEDTKREVPDYDGREEPTSAGDVLIWLPRIALSPFYLVSEFVVRRPLGFLVSSIERAKLPQTLYDLFTFGPNNNAGLAPVAFLDFGFDPSVGVYFFWNDAFAPGHDLRLRAATWGDDWVSANFSSRTHFGHDASVAVKAIALRRPDYVFFGLGPRSLERNLGRYGRTTYEGSVELDVGLWRTSRVLTEVGLRTQRFRQGEYGDEPTLGDRVARGDYAEPPGYGRRYTVLYNRIMLAIDSREAAPAPGSGARLELRAEQQSPLTGNPAGWVRYGAVGGLFYDLVDRGRVISLSGGVMFADPLGDHEIPFTEQVELGGTEAMRGFVPGRLVGRSSAAATLAYRWPIWVFIDGAIQLSIGNVFGKHLEDFDPELLRFSAAIGIESRSSRDSAIELLLGLGSETFAQGGTITSFRFIFGSHYGF